VDAARSSPGAGAGRRGGVGPAGPGRSSALRLLILRRRRSRAACALGALGALGAGLRLVGRGVGGGQCPELVGMAEMLGIDLRGRQLDPEGGAAARGLPRPDRTLILLDQGRGDRQAQARAAALTGRARAGLIGAVEALEDLLTLLLVQARPVIAHLDQQGAVL